MGLASKMAAAGGGAALAAGGGAAMYSAIQGQQPARPGNPPYPTNQQQYQAYPGSAPPPGQPGYGAPPPFPQQAGYGAPPSQLRPEAFRQSLQQTIQDKNIQNMFVNPAILDQICQAAPAKVEHLCQQWRVPREVGQDIVKLALFDIIIYVDDSGSMQFEEHGERIQDMKLILAKAAFAASLFDSDGIEIRFMNSDKQGNNVRTEQEVEALVSQIQFKGLTPMGTQLRNKVLEPLVVQRARSNQLRKPVLIITITDGQPAGEPTGAVFDAIKYASNELSRSPYGKGAVSFEFAQVGNDLKAREFLGKLDNEPGVGELVDSTSNFEVEQDEMSRAQPPVDLTPDLWLLKLLLGAIDSSYDTKDEKGSRPSGGQGGYVAPGQQQYGANPPGQYGGPPPQQGQYGQQPHYGAPPPQQGYYGQAPPSQYGAPPPQQGQGQYGQQTPYGVPPPQQGQYGQYGAPAPQYGQPGQYPHQGQQNYPPQGGQPQGGYPGQQSYNKPPPRY